MDRFVRKNLHFKSIFVHDFPLADKKNLHHKFFSTISYLFDFYEFHLQLRKIDFFSPLWLNKEKSKSFFFKFNRQNLTFVRKLLLLRSMGVTIERDTPISTENPTKICQAILSNSWVEAYQAEIMHIYLAFRLFIEYWYCVWVFSSFWIK